ncbi:MAG: hypothetical protein JNL30_05155 [Rubrivivax sp.]|nr:hypothetical protein [Rubrivivax sp.]
MRRPWKRPLAAGLLCAAAGAAAQAPAEGGQAAPSSASAGPGGEWRLVAAHGSASSRGPLAAADRLAPGLAPPAGLSAAADVELRHTLHLQARGLPLSLAANAWLQGTAPEHRASRAAARFNELHLGADLGPWQASVGRKVVGWDVGYGFRPNDVVQQEARRTLLATTPQGRPLAMLEHFGAEHALSAVWANPQRWNKKTAAADQAGTPSSAEASADESADESAIALRGYRRFGALDAHGFARHGRRTGASLGAALSWVATDELELHVSWRGLQRHEGWQIAAAAGASAQTTNPWRRVLRGGGATQWLAGAHWTGLGKQSVMVEAWHDGTALPDGQWDDWQHRNAALASAAPPLPAAAVAGNLAWQATPFDAPNLRQDNLFLRLAWSPEPWQLSFDTLFMPADRGRLHTLAVQWQGAAWRLQAAWRMSAGPAQALVVQLPTRRTLMLAAIHAF